MKNINNAFNKLKKTCNVIWTSDDHDALYIYSYDKKYRIFVSYDLNIIEVEKRFLIFKWEYWDSLFHWHPGDYKDDADFYDEVLGLCNKNNILVVKKTLLYSTIKVISNDKFKVNKRRYKSNLFRKCYIINIIL